MINSKHYIKAVLIFFILFVPTAAFSHDACGSFGIWSDTVESQTNFVKVPTYIGGFAGFISGMVVGGAVGLPIGLISAPFTKGRSIGDATFGGIMYGGCTLMSTVGFLCGAPFYVVEKTFWDFPRWIISPKEDKPKEEVCEE